MTSRRGYHGLPAEYHTPDGEREDWTAVLGYLRTLEKSGRPVVVAITDLRHTRLSEQIGFLRVLPDHADQPTVHRLALNWPDPDQSCGEYTVDERLCEGATLSTSDGDDFFWLTLALGPVAMVVLDSNANMWRAGEEWRRRWRRTYYSLPTAEEIERKWEAEPDRVRIRELKRELEQLRADLVERGATRAEGMSAAELSAAGERVSWNLRASGRMGKVDPEDWYMLWVDEFADQLRGGAG
jgi:hypothetical protein